jgi:ABC-type multidrug transport system fused ATPase/permease subunit
VLAEGLRILGHGIRLEPRIFAIAFAGSAGFGLLTVATAYLTGDVVGRVVVPSLDRGEVAPAALALGAAAFIVLALLKVAALFGRRLGAGVMQFRLQARYRRLVTRRYLELPLAWHRRHPTGALLSNANSDVEAVFYTIAPMPFAVGSVVMLVGAIVSLFLIDWAFALVGLALFPMLAALNILYSRRMSPRVARVQAVRAEASTLAHQSFDGGLVVKTLGREQEETERFAAEARELRDAMISVGRLRGFFDPLLDMLPSVGTLAVLGVGAVRLRQGVVGVDDIVSVSILFTVMAFPVRAIGWVLTELPRSVVGWDRVRNVLSATGEMAYGTANSDATGPAWMRFVDVGYAYDAADPVLDEISFDVPAGGTVALVGPTGSGKSTVAALAARLIDPDRGAVEIDGVDVRELTAGALAATVGLVPQVPFVFDDTVAGNVSLGRAGVGDEGVRAALRLAQAESFVERLPEGVLTPVGERGTSLSGGQRQRLTLARALAGRPRLLVLDDATSAVDPRVEAAILAGLRGAGTSILVVAYRRATITLADEVVYMEHGRVVARGRHEQLLATVAGYAELVRAYERAEADREDTLDDAAVAA